MQETERESVEYALNCIQKSNGAIYQLLSELRTIQPPSLVELSAKNLIETVSGMVAPAAAEKNISINVADCADCTILADENKLINVLINLLYNSIDAIEKDGKIEINTEITDENMLKISVKDNGCGIAPKEFQNIFKEGYTTKTIGNGLGLYISTKARSIAHEVRNHISIIDLYSKIANKKIESLFNVRAIEVSKLAMDGLLERQKAISSNTANAVTPDYQRKDVVFEDQLREIIEKDNVRRDLRMKNSAAYQNTDTYRNPITADAAKKLPQEQMIYLGQTDFDATYKPEVLRDYTMIDYGNGNNVNIEEEMMDMAKAGSQYSVLATVESRLLGELQTAIGTGGA